MDWPMTSYYGSFNLPSVPPVTTPPPSSSSSVIASIQGSDSHVLSSGLSSPCDSRSISISTSSFTQQIPQKNRKISMPYIEDPNTPEFLAWRRLHLSKAKLSGITEVAALMAGFSVVATVELQINDDANPLLLTVFTVTTALLVCTTMMAIMISTCILPHIEVVAATRSTSKANESPHDQMQGYIDTAWILANFASIFLFTFDIIVLAWIKFAYFSMIASWCATAIMIPALFGICIFGLMFYRKTLQHQALIAEKKYHRLEKMVKKLEQEATSVIIEDEQEKEEDEDLILRMGGSTV